MKIEKSIPIKLKWDSFAFPIKRCTPISADGTEANSSDAVGLVIDQINERPYDELSVYVMTGGYVDDAEVKSAYGDMSDDAKNALGGISFSDNDGAISPRGGTGGGTELSIKGATLDYLYIARNGRVSTTIPVLESSSKLSIVGYRQIFIQPHEQGTQEQAHAIVLSGFSTVGGAKSAQVYLKNTADEDARIKVSVSVLTAQI